MVELEDSAAISTWPSLARGRHLDERLASAAMARGRLTTWAYEFVRFGVKQAWACLFGGLLVAIIIATRLWYPQTAPLHRYDLLFLSAVAIQAVLLATRMETIEEAKVIFAYHLVGTLMELHKTAIGSWLYPEPSLFHIAGVPLFSGFMYASIGSYLARVWRLFDFRFTRHPPLFATSLLAIAIYVNFLTNHWLPDIRVVLMIATIALFARTKIFFKVWRTYRSMPLLLGFGLVALFIWFAENIGTVTGTWLYPRQLTHWTWVPISKLSSWLLLMIVSYAMVAVVNGIRHRGSTADEPAPHEPSATPARA